MAKAWKDPAFKAKLLKNPSEALEEMGWEVPENITVKTIEDKPGSYTFMLPSKPVKANELSEKELMELAGGSFTCGFTDAC